jgi:hypothetical protein
MLVRKHHNIVLSTKDSSRHMTSPLSIRTRLYDGIGVFNNDPFSSFFFLIKSIFSLQASLKNFVNFIFFNLFIIIVFFIYII